MYVATPCMSCFRSRLYNRLEELFKVERYGGKNTILSCKFGAQTFISIFL